MKHNISQQHPPMGVSMKPKGAKNDVPSKVVTAPKKSPGQSKPKAFRDSKY